METISATALRSRQTEDGQARHSQACNSRSFTERFFVAPAWPGQRVLDIGIME